MTQARVTTIPQTTPLDLKLSLELMLAELSSVRQQLTEVQAKVEKLEKSEG